ncbi:dynactin subunit 1 [Neocloeon triangulifer]|uniref:dynactin subunit 1 n=1 Tax=Neocloeon triangulifer TaxID=2078957 RepID=UPI00286F41A5|nr:dynactin subunit 1 [Neocloeon triangulifer]
MELKVWVEGIQRIICGVTENTSCQDIVYALAHATGQTGRFTLIERWRNNERLLAPNEHPLKILNKWGEYSNDVQFVLQRTTAPSSSDQSPSKFGGSPTTMVHSPKDGAEPSRNIKKSLTISSGTGYQNHRIGVVQGVPQRQQPPPQQQPQPSPDSSSSDLKSASQTQSPPPYREPPKPTLPPYRAPPHPATSPRSTPDPFVDDSFDRSRSMSGLYKASGAKSPSPSPVSSAMPSVQNSISDLNQSSSSKMSRKSAQKVSQQEEIDSGFGSGEPSASVLLTPQYKELMRLVNQQREKLGSLQADLTKYDAEINFWESKSREQQHKVEYCMQESLRLQETSKMLEDQLMALKNIEEEKDISKQQGKTLKSEITLLRSKLANCETELLQCRVKIRHLFDELKLEQRTAAMEDTDEKINSNLELMSQLEKLQKQVEEAKSVTAKDLESGRKLDEEVESLENVIGEKKKQLELLVQDMKDANLHSLSIAPSSDEGLRSCLLEGIHRSSRKMIGSPRQLENAVPTSKNPHGVWV